MAYPYDDQGQQGNNQQPSSAANGVPPMSGGYPPQPQPGYGLDPTTAGFSPVQSPSGTPGYIRTPQTQPAASIPERKIKPRGPWLILGIVFIVLTLIVSGVLVWLYITYSDLNSNFNTKVSVRVSDEKKSIRTDMQNILQDELKKPYNTFVGPDDYGRVTFQYPKTWSVYVSNDENDDDNSYEAYFNPSPVPPINNTQRYALRLTISTEDYQTAIDDYSYLLNNNEITSSAVSLNNNSITGTEFVGNLTDNIKGTAIVIKVRDKVLTLRTDAEAFYNDYNALVNTLTINQ